MYQYTWIAILLLGRDPKWTMTYALTFGEIFLLLLYPPTFFCLKRFRTELDIFFHTVTIPYSNSQQQFAYRCTQQQYANINFQQKFDYTEIQIQYRNFFLNRFYTTNFILSKINILFFSCFFFLVFFLTRIRWWYCMFNEKV